MRPARRDEALRLQRPDQRDREGGGEDRLGRHAPEEDLQVAPHVSGRTTSGSYASRMPNCFSTPARTSSASLSKSALVPPRFTSASACRVEIPAPAPPPPPPPPPLSLGNPAGPAGPAARRLPPPPPPHPGRPPPPRPAARHARPPRTPPPERPPA